MSEQPSGGENQNNGTGGEHAVERQAAPAERLQRFLRSLSQRLEQSASVCRTFGEPVTAGDKTIIPVARVGYGVGGGTGSQPREDEDDCGASFGAGGGVGATPLGVVEVTRRGTRFIACTSGKRLVTVAAVALLLGFLLGRRR